jgi:hypothetical protein
LSNQTPQLTRLASAACSLSRPLPIAMTSPIVITPCAATVATHLDLAA